MTQKLMLTKEKSTKVPVSIEKSNTESAEASQPYAKSEPEIPDV